LAKVLSSGFPLLGNVQQVRVQHVIPPIRNTSFLEQQEQQKMGQGEGREKNDLGTSTVGKNVRKKYSMQSFLLL
jgi:hypothetical protein